MSTAAEKQVELDALQEEYDSYVESSQELEEELENSLAHAEKSLTESEELRVVAESNIGKLNDKLAKAEKSFVESEQKKAVTESKLIQLEQATKQSSLDSDELKSTKESLKSSSESVKSLEKAKKDLTDMVGILEQSERELQNQLEDAKSAVEKSQEGNERDIEELQEEVELLTLKLAETEEQNLELNVEVEKMTDELMQMHTVEKGLLNDKKDVETDNLSCRTELSDALEKVQSLEIDLKEAKENNTDNLSCRTELSDALEKVQSLEIDLKEAIDNNKTLEEYIQSLKGKIVDSEKELQITRGKLSLAKEKVKDVNASDEDTGNNVSEKQSLSDSKKLVLVSLRESNATVQSSRLLSPSGTKMFSSFSSSPLLRTAFSCSKPRKFSIDASPKRNEMRKPSSSPMGIPLESSKTANIATRSREALQRHQARLDKLNEMKKI